MLYYKIRNKKNVLLHYHKIFNVIINKLVNVFFS